MRINMKQQQLKHLQFALLSPVCPIHDTYHAQIQALGDCPFLFLSVTIEISSISKLKKSNVHNGTTG